MDCRLALAAVALLIGCHSDPLPSIGSDDLGPAAQPDLAPFCDEASSAHMELNGTLAWLQPTASSLALNCCAAGTVDTSQMPGQRISVIWEYQGGLPQVPVTLDLANLPPRWKVIVQSGCSPIEPNCQPTDSYFDGLTGTVTVSPSNFGAFQMSACITVSEPQGMPHPVIHSLRLWIPTVSTT